MKLRSEVQWFAEQMELKLRENDDKGGWKRCSIEFLLDRLQDEMMELDVSIQRGIPELLVAECADVANFCMMLADNRRLIAKEESDDAE